jgi:hypothetical protein
LKELNYSYKLKTLTKKFKKEKPKDTLVSVIASQESSKKKELELYTEEI